MCALDLSKAYKVYFYCLFNKLLDRGAPVIWLNFLPSGIHVKK